MVSCAAGLLLPCSLDAATEARRVEYDVRQQLVVNAPPGTRHLRIWFAMPVRESHQDIENFRVLAPSPHRRVQDQAGNRQVFIETQPPFEEVYVITQTFRLIRTEQISGVHPEFTRPMDEAERTALAPFLAPGRTFPVDEAMRELAGGIVEGETNPTLAARRLYNWVLDHAEYWVKDPDRYAASGAAGAHVCLKTGSGDSTDLHALWVSLARSAGIPSRLVYGTVLNTELNRMDADLGARCWAEFYAPGYGWVPLDVATADLFSGAYPIHDRNGRRVRLATPDGYRGPSRDKVDFYFGNLDARRLVLSRGSDLALNPPAAAGLVPDMAKAYVEADGAVLPEGSGWSRKLTYRQRKSN